MQLANKVVLTTTTFYKDPGGKDKVRFELVCELTELARSAGHTVVIADGSPVPDVRERLVRAGALVFPRSRVGMGAMRRQVWTEAGNFITSDIAAILWTEEKPDIVRSIGKMVACIRERNAQVAVISRSQASWETYPGFQRRSEEAANLVYNNLFPNGDELSDPMFGPVCFLPSELIHFAVMNPTAWNLPDTYLQHYVPVFMRSRGHEVISCEVNFVYPPKQRAEEETVKIEEMVEKRLSQMRQLVAAYFAIHQRLGPVPR